MPTMTKYDPGTPCWVELATTDLDAAKKFYGDVLGWSDYETGGEETGFYTTPKIDGKRVCGMMGHDASAGVPPHWGTYVSVPDAEATAKKAKDLGATVLVEPMDVMDLGRMVVMMDPEGAAISAWQPKQHIGAEIHTEPGAWCWNELYSKDPDKAKEFYKGLFGWGSHSSTEPMEYTEFQVGDRTIGGMMKLTEQMGPMPPNWLVYFDVEDTPATIEKVNKAGGNVLMGPMQIDGVGNIAVIADPQGAVFAVIKMEMEH